MTATIPSSRVYENPVIGDKIIFHKTCRETGGKETLIEVELAVKGGNELHYHRQFAETFTALEGQLSLQVGDKILRLHPGESATAEPMVEHRFFNEDKSPIRFLVKLSPGDEGFEKAIQIAYGMACDGLVNKGGVPKNIHHLALIATISGIGMVGLHRLIEPLFGWLARRAMRAGMLQELEARYCRL